MIGTSSDDRGDHRYSNLCLHLAGLTPWGDAAPGAGQTRRPRTAPARSWQDPRSYAVPPAYSTNQQRSDAFFGRPMGWKAFDCRLCSSPSSIRLSCTCRAGSLGAQARSTVFSCCRPLCRGPVGCGGSLWLPLWAPRYGLRGGQLIRRRASDGIAGAVSIAIATLRRLGLHPLFDPGCKERGTHKAHRHDRRIGRARLGEVMAGPIFMD